MRGRQLHYDIDPVGIGLHCSILLAFMKYAEIVGN